MENVWLVIKHYNEGGACVIGIYTTEADAKAVRRAYRGCEIMEIQLNTRVDIDTDE